VRKDSLALLNLKNEKIHPDFWIYVKWYRLWDKSFIPPTNGSNPIIKKENNGYSANKAFLKWENGEKASTKHPRLLFSALQGKVNLNFQIKQWAEGFIECGGKYYLEEIRLEFPFLRDWVFESIVKSNLKNEKCNA